MRYSEDHNAEVRARIVEAASRALRRDGVDAVSIPKVMKLVGLTHGSFYVHFKDRDDLVAAAVAHAANDGAARFDAPGEAAITRYLSMEHVSKAERGCVVAALGMEGARQKGRSGKAFASAARGLLAEVERRLHPEGAAAPSDAALATAARMVGAVVLARLVQDEALAERILAASRPARKALERRRARP